MKIVLNLNKRDLKRMTKDRQFMLNPSAAAPKHLLSKTTFCNYQTVHLNFKEFEKMNGIKKENVDVNEFLSIKYKDKYFDLPEHITIKSVSINFIDFQL